MTSLLCPEHERQPRINDFWSWKSGDTRAIWLLLYIIADLAPFIDKRENNTLPAKSWKWASLERQQFLALHQSESQCDVSVSVNMQSYDRFYRHKPSGTLNPSLENELSSICPGGCHGNISYLSGYKGCQLMVYRCLWSSATWITQDAWPEIVDTHFAMGVSPICENSIWHRRSVMVFWQPFYLFHLLSSLSLHCSLIIHTNIFFKIYFKVSADCTEKNTQQSHSFQSMFVFTVRFAW